MKKLMALLMISVLMFGCASSPNQPKNQSMNSSNGVHTSDSGNNVTLNSTNKTMKPASGDNNGQIVDVGGSIGMQHG